MLGYFIGLAYCLSAKLAMPILTISIDLNVHIRISEMESFQLENFL